MRALLLSVLCTITGCAIVVEEPSGGNNGLTGKEPTGGGGSKDGGGAAACFAADDPAFITPRAPVLSTAEACVATGARKDTYASESEVLALLVGTWIPCGPSKSWFLSHPGFVVGGDRTFRFLESKSGALVPTEILGRVSVLPTFDGRYQVNVDRADGTNMLHITQVGIGDRVDIQETGGSGTFARTAPGAAATATAYVDSGTCALAGTWDSQAGVGEGFKKTSGTFAFDGRGHFVGGALGSEICSAPAITGTYSLVADAFEIVTSTGMGCPTPYGATWKVSFSTDCKSAYLSMKTDGCTGGRHSIAYDTILTRK